MVKLFIIFCYKDITQYQKQASLDIKIEFFFDIFMIPNNNIQLSIDIARCGFCVNNIRDLAQLKVRNFKYIKVEFSTLI